jgi:hypothetical protein
METGAPVSLGTPATDQCPFVFTHDENSRIHVVKTETFEGAVAHGVAIRIDHKAEPDGLYSVEISGDRKWSLKSSSAAPKLYVACPLAVTGTTTDFIVHSIGTLYDLTVSFHEPAIFIAGTALVRGNVYPSGDIVIDWSGVDLVTTPVMRIQYLGQMRTGLQFFYNRHDNATGCRSGESDYTVPLVDFGDGVKGADIDFAHYGVETGTYVTISHSSPIMDPAVYTIDFSVVFVGVCLLL